MDVDDPSLERAEELPLEDAHESGEDHEVHPRLAQCGDVGRLGRLIQFGAEFSGLEEATRQVARLRVAENAGVHHVGQHERHPGVHRAGRNGVGDGAEIGALAGTEDANAERGCVRHARI